MMMMVMLVCIVGASTLPLTCGLLLLLLLLPLLLLSSSQVIGNMVTNGGTGNF